MGSWGAGGLQAEREGYVSACESESTGPLALPHHRAVVRAWPSTPLPEAPGRSRSSHWASLDRPTPRELGLQGWVRPLLQVLPLRESLGRWGGSGLPSCSQNALAMSFP